MPYAAHALKWLRGGDGAAGPLRLPDAPVLLEGLGALDRRGVHARRDVDVVGAAVAGDGALVGAGRPVGAPVVDDVVLDERVRRPAVQRQVGVAGRAEGAGVGHAAAGAGAPALAGDEVAGVLPRRAVVAAGAEVHRDGAGGVGPERVEVAVVGALRVRGDGGLGVGGHHHGGGGGHDGAGSGEEQLQSAAPAAGRCSREASDMGWCLLGVGKVRREPVERIDGCQYCRGRLSLSTTSGNLPITFCVRRWC